MTIEFQTPYGKVSETLVNSIRNKLLDLSHIHKKISRAEVLLREDIRAITGVNKVCEINLSIYGANLYVHTRTESFEISTKDAVKDLKRLVKQQVQKKELISHLLSTEKL